MKRYQPWLHALYHAIFWSWNLVFLLIVFAGLLPHLGVPLALAIGAGEIDAAFLLPLFGILAIPPACTWLGWRYFRRRPVELMRLFYGIEAPAFLLCLVRMFLLRDLTPASLLTIATVLMAIASFSVELFAGSHRRRPRLAALQTGASLSLWLVGAWAGTLLLIYVVPAAKFLLDGLLSFQWWQAFRYELTYLNLAALFYLALFALFFAISASLFLAMPSALAALYLHSGWRQWRAFAGDRGRARLLQIGLGTSTAWLILFLACNQQPQVAAFARLEADASTLAARRALLADADSLRRGLTNAYLASYRYLGSRQEGAAIADLYRRAFDLPENLTGAMQGLHDGLLSPFLYQGTMGDDAEAAERYAAFFDQPIQKGEQAAILRALRSTAILDDAQAGTLNINQRKVWLAKQEVTVTEQGDWAAVELYEVYRNQTPDEEEIFYSFSLPETAVVTGLWLGDTAARDRRFPFQVSPRGAAQKVYKEQVNRVRPVDPALLEQVGPRHYRLRAFPIPPPRASWETEPLNRPTEMHLWLTYQVLRQDQGWPLPQLSERRNLFWTAQTERIRNGEAVAAVGDRWLEASLPARSVAPAAPAAHTARLAGYQVTATPVAEPAAALPSGQRFAVVLDTSYSMGDRRAEVQGALDWLQEQGLADGNLANGEADLYVARAPGLEPQRFANLQQFNWRGQPAYGSLQLADLLAQFDRLRAGQAYAATLLLTDAGSYELADDRAEVPARQEPLWIVHAGGEFPPAYQDRVLEAMQDSQGGVATSLPEVFQRLAATAQQQARLANSAAELANLADGYVWTLEPLPAQTANAEPDGFAPLAARQLVQGLSWEQAGDELAQLDAIHAIAQQAAIVTPYSSMVVLVNDEQRRALAEAEAAADRFDREVEDGQENLAKPFSPLQAGEAASVPEPGIVLGLGAIALFLRRRRPLWRWALNRRCAWMRTMRCNRMGCCCCRGGDRA